MAKQCRVCLIQEPYATFVSMHAGKKENAINYLIVTGIMLQPNAIAYVCTHCSASLASAAQLITLAKQSLKNFPPGLKISKDMVISKAPTKRNLSNDTIVLDSEDDDDDDNDKIGISSKIKRPCTSNSNFSTTSCETVEEAIKKSKTMKRTRYDRSRHSENRWFSPESSSNYASYGGESSRSLTFDDNQFNFNRFDNRAAEFWKTAISQLSRSNPMYKKFE